MSDKKELIEISNNIYASETDKNFWIKKLQYNPNDPETLYNAALRIEEQALEYRNLFYSTEFPIYFKYFEKKMKEAIKLMSSSSDKGFKKANKEKLRLVQEYNSYKNKEINNKYTESNKKENLILFLLGVIIGLICVILVLLTIL